MRGMTRLENILPPPPPSPEREEREREKERMGGLFVGC